MSTLHHNPPPPPVSPLLLPCCHPMPLLPRPAARFIDWDARCHGHAARCFALPANYSGVGMTAYLVGPYDPSGHRFHELAGEINKTAIEARHHSFLPLVRFSKHFLAQVGGGCVLWGSQLRFPGLSVCFLFPCSRRGQELLS